MLSTQNSKTGMLKVKYVKKILLPLLLVFLSLSSRAWIRQTDSALYISPYCDILYTHLRNHIYGNELSPGYSMGFGTNVYFTQWQEFGFTAGLGYNSRKFNLDNSIAVFNDIHEQIDEVRGYFDINYLTFPLSARYNLGKKFNLYLDVGIRLNILLSSEKYAMEDSLPPETNDPQSYRYDITEDHPSMCFSLQAGAGMEYFINSRFAVYMDYKYIQDISPLFVYKNLPQGTVPKMYAHTLKLGIRWGIPIKYSVNRRH